MAGDGARENWDPRGQVDEEMEFFTELALHETERWIQAVTRRKFAYPDDPRKSLENGILLCELINGIKPGSVKRINRLNTPIAGLDNIHVFLAACRRVFGLTDAHLFDACDLEDLSQRAIADTDYFQQENDRRLTNVAITIYWLGKQALEFYEGPLLDITAFSALVKHHSKNLISDGQYPHDSWDSLENSTSFNDSHPNEESLNASAETKSHLDSSYDSYGSYERVSADSLDSPCEGNMPVREDAEYDSPHDGRMNASLFPKEKKSVDHQGSLSPGYHARSPSTDSLDGSLHGNHSRQSSGSVDNYATRPPARKTSAANVNPLQFIKTSADELAMRAVEQFKLAEENKRITPIKTERVTDEDDGSWRENLSNWRNRRRKLSAPNYELKERLEAIEKEEEEKDKGKRPVKTYKDMVEERAQRQMMSYPVDDDDDTDSPFSQPSLAPDENRATNDNQPESFITKSAASEVNRNPAPTMPKSNNRSVEEAYVPKRSSPILARDSSSEESSESGTDNEKSEEVDPRITQSKPALDNNSPRYSEPPQRQYENTLHDITNNDKAVEAKRPKSSQYVNDDKWIKSNVERQNSRNDRESQNTRKISDIRNKFEEPKKAEKPTPAKRSVDPHRTAKPTDAFSEIHNRWESDEPKDSKKQRSSDIPERNNNTSSASSYSQSSTLSNDTTRNFVEKNIKISQKPNSSKGFGFTFTGGIDSGCSPVVETITLGSAADVCELLKQDELISVNHMNVRSCSHSEIRTMIDEAVGTGHIDLKVRRHLEKGGYHDSFSDEDFGEESMSPIEKTPPSTKPPPPPVAVAADLPDGEDTSGVELRRKPRGNRQSEPERQGWNRDQSWTSNEPVEEEIVQPRRVVRKVEASALPPWRQSTPTKAAPESRDYDHSSPGQSKVNRDSSLSPSSNKESDGEDPSSRPPDILLKWQKTRPKSDYNYSSYNKEPTYSPKPREVDPLSKTLPWQMESKITFDSNVTKDDSALHRTIQDFGLTVQQNKLSMTLPARTNAFDLEAEQHKMADWNDKQERILKPETSFQVESQSSPHKEQFENDRAVIQNQWEQDKGRAQASWDQKQEQEKAFLGADVQRMADLEEKYQREFQDRFTKRSSLQIAAVNQKGEPPASGLAPMVITLPTNSQNQPIQIDARNRATHDSRNPQVQEVNFKVNATKNMQPFNSSAVPRAQYPVTREAKRPSGFPEKRDKFRNENARHLEAEYKRKEEEESRKLKQKEQELWQKEEKLRQEQEKLRQGQEQLTRERDQQRSWKLQQATKADSHVPQPITSPRQHFNRPPNTVTSPTGKQQPVYSSSVVVSAKATPPNFYVKQIEPTRNDVKVISNVDTYHESRHPENLSREDLVHMSKQATPFQKQPLFSENSPNNQPITREPPSKKELHSLNAVPKRRTMQSADWIVPDDELGEIEAPKPQPRRSEIIRREYSNPQEHWLIEEAERRRLAQHAPQHRHSMHNMYTEGPIKPADDFVNRWRESQQRKSVPTNLYGDAAYEKSIPEQIKQTLKERVSGGIRPTHYAPNYQSPVEDTPAQNQPQDNYSKYYPHSKSANFLSPSPSSPDYGTQPAGPRIIKSDAADTYESQPGNRLPKSDPPSPPIKPPRTAGTNDNVASHLVQVSGKQKCSHCGQELGFGAAMVIESLDLYYHVQCFRCFVCRMVLGNGSNGADVRVRVSKLHCGNCYSNDEAKYSKV